MSFLENVIEKNSVDKTIQEENIGSLIGKAKRIWTQSKTERIVNDRIDRSESPLFVNDYTLALLVEKKQEIEQEIIQHIDNKLTKSRCKNTREE